MNQESIIKVSIIIPTINRIDLLMESLHSVINQTISNWECIVIDDGSTDQTESIVRKFVLEDIRFKYFKRPNYYPKGASNCRNYGLELSKGEYIQWLDDDDLLSDNKLELQTMLLDQLNDIKIFTTCDWDLFWKNKIYERKSIFNSVLFFTAYDFFLELRKQQTFLPIHSYLIHRDLIKLSGNWNVDLTLNDDAEFITRILLKSKKLVNTEGCFVLYRSHQKERISGYKDAHSLRSFILSLRLMNNYLKFNDIECIPYFRWRLLKVFYNNWKLNSALLKEHFYFFKENGINLNFARYYMLKEAIYKKVYPLYKKYKLNSKEVNL